jgi:chemotaxis protein CheY-P-specific phosphatase CheC
MQLGDEELCELTETVFESCVGMVLSRIDDVVVPDPAIFGYVHITGGWEGSVVVQCEDELARRLAAAMFGSEPGVVTPEEVSDAIGEIANVTAGNVKSRLGVACQLSMPGHSNVVDIEAAFPQSQLIRRYTFEAEGMPVVVGILQRGW